MVLGNFRYELVLSNFVKKNLEEKINNELSV